jgi:hypothetical protein
VAATKNSHFDNFNDFADFVVRKLETVYGSNGDVVFYHAKSSGMLNDYFDVPESWTEEMASRLFLRICCEERRARQVLSSFHRYLPGSLDGNDD